MTETPPVRKGPAPPIGIDLGTTYSCAAYCENGKVTIVKNELGINTTPSYVAFPDPNQTNSTLGIIIGDSAKNQVDINPENVIYDVKRLIGRKFNDHIVQKDIELWPFKVIDEENTPRISVNGNDYHPEKISALVLGYLKKQAEVQIGGPVTDAVITVPAYFNDGQRQATRDAGSIAGLNVLRIINEPTAAAIAYNHQLQHKSQKSGQDSLRKKNVLIFDLGGGTFDLALLTMEGENIEVKAVDGDTHLGGQDIDNALVNYCIDEFKKKHNGIDLSKCQPNAPNAVAEKFNMGKRLRRIKNECELRKINLSNAKAVKISLEVIYQGEDLNVRIKRETFESICKPTFDKCIAIVDRILRDANMAKEEVDDVVLVGGSSRIPKIQDMLQTYFGGRKPLQNIKQDEAVAYGAAVEAISCKAAAADDNNKQSQSSKSQTQSSSSSSASSSSSGPNPPPIKKVIFTDVIPLSIGIQVHVEKGEVEDFSTVLKKNTAVPHSTKKRFKTVYDNQKSVLIAIYEGQGITVKDNHLLGEFHLNNLPPGCRKGEPIDVQMDVNKEGILTVTAECPANKNSYNLTVTSLKGRLKREEVEQLRIQQMYEMKNTLANF